MERLGPDNPLAQGTGTCRANTPAATGGNGGGYSSPMTDIDFMLVEVPGDLGAELLDAGFEEGLQFKGAGHDAGTVVAVLATGISLAANVTIVVVAREEIAEFADLLRDWFRRGARHEVGTRLELDLSVKTGTEERRVHVHISSDADTVNLDTAEVSALMTSILSADSGEGGREEVSPT